MIKSFYLPLSHDEHMPPDGKAQLSGTEIAVLKAWIRSGADFDKKLADYRAPDSLKIVVAALIAAQPGETTERIYAFSSAAESSIIRAQTKASALSEVENGGTWYQNVYSHSQACPG